MPQFDTITVTPAAAVATDGTIVFTYPAGRAAASYAQSGEILVASGLQNVLEQAADTFTVAYGGSSATVTYKDATSLPAGKAVTLQLPLATAANLVDNSGGTGTGTIAAIGATYTQAEVRNAVATLAKRINEISNVLRANNIT